MKDTELLHEAVSARRGTLNTWLHVLAAIALLYVFLVSIDLMGDAFKLFGGGFAKALIKQASNPVLGLFVGVLATSLIQSSSTTTSLTVGFVGAGVLPLEFAIPMLMGANIGTTITNTLVSFGFVTRKEDFRRAFAGAVVHDFFNLCSVIVLFPLELRFHIIQKSAEAATRIFSSAGGAKLTSPVKAAVSPVSDAVKALLTETVGLHDVPAGVIVLLLAVAALITSLIFLVKVLRGVVLQRAEGFINRYLFRNDLTAFVLGIGLTIMAQSSSITTSLIVPLVGAGVVTLYRCYPYTLGANIGTTCTALLAALATIKGGEAGCVGVTAAFAHLLFNIFGIAIFYPLRIIPVSMALRLGTLATESKRWAVVFVVGIFFVLPVLLILLT